MGVVHILDLPVKEPTGGWPTTKSERDRAETDARSEAARPYAWPDIEDVRKRLNRLRGDASISALETVDRADPYTVPVEGPVLRRHHLDDLFDTDPDLSGGHLDVSRFVRGDATDLDVGGALAEPRQRGAGERPAATPRRAVQGPDCWLEPARFRQAGLVARAAAFPASKRARGERCTCAISAFDPGIR